jgi:flagellar export protein FliJ
MARRFKWRFETVKNAKEREEERHRENLVEARRVLGTEEAKLAELHADREDCLGQLREKQAGRLNTTDISLVLTYLEDLDQKIQKQTQTVEQARSAAESKREILAQTVQENKILENLRERDNEKFRKAERKKDQAETDEAAIRGGPNRERMSDST